MEHNFVSSVISPHEVNLLESLPTTNNSASSSPDQYYEYSGTEEDEALLLLVDSTHENNDVLPLHTFNLLFAERNNTSLWNQFENTRESSKIQSESIRDEEVIPKKEECESIVQNKRNIFAYDFQTVLSEGCQNGKLVFLQFCDYHTSEYASRGLMPIHAIRVYDSNRFMVLLNGESKFWLFERYSLPHHDAKCDYYRTTEGQVNVNLEFSLFMKPLQISAELECIGTGIMRHLSFTKGFRFVASPKKLSFILDYSLANQSF